mgnify:CR=1 FL=1
MFPNMKKVFLCGLMAAAALATQAQNVQLHYDFGRNLYSDEEAGRQKVTMTLEQFKADQWGSWYYFVDFDFNRKETMAAYTEISREFNIAKHSPFAIHVEYDGGLASGVGSYQQAGLIGAAYNSHNADFSKTWSLQLMYKQYFKDANGGKAYASAQLTGVWGLHFFDRQLTFAGFIDFWRGQQANGHGQLVILTEPQLWYNFTENFSLGTEWELSNNFIYNTDYSSDKSFFVNPTLAVKWNF